MKAAQDLTAQEMLNLSAAEIDAYSADDLVLVNQALGRLKDQLRDKQKEIVAAHGMKLRKAQAEAILRANGIDPASVEIKVTLPAAG